MMNSEVAGEVVKGQVKLSALAPEVCAAHFRQPIACTAFVWSLIEKAVQYGGDLDGIVHNLCGWREKTKQSLGLLLCPSSWLCSKE